MDTNEYEMYQEVFKHADNGTLNTTILPEYGGPTVSHSTYRFGLMVIGLILLILFIVEIVYLSQ